MRNRYLTMALLLCASMVVAQEGGKAYQYLDIGQVKARINNSSDHFWDLNGNQQYEVPKGSGNHVNFAGSLWIGGLDGTGNLKMAAQTYRQWGTDFFSGPYRTTHNYDTGRGFDVAAGPEIDGVLTIDNGKQLVIHDNGFSVYDPVSTTLVQRTLAVPRFRLKGVYLPNGKTLIFGDNTYPIIQDAYLLDPGNGYSPQSPVSLQHYHRHSAAVLMNNGLVLITGLAGSELYDPTTHTSTPTQPMPVPVMASGAVLLPDGRVFLAGGNPVYSTYNTARFETQLFDPNTNTWSLGPNLPASLVLPMTLLQPNGKVLIMGGSTTQAGIYEFDPLTNLVSTIGQLPAAFQMVKGGLLPSGEVIYIGSEFISNANGKVFLLNPATGISEELGTHAEGGQAWTTANGTAVLEFSPKKFREFSPLSRQFINMKYQKVWKLSSAEISLFRQDFANNTVNFALYPDIETWPGNGITSKGEDAQLAPYVDVNSDGLYRPATDGDYPCILGDQALWWVFNDDGVHAETGGLPIGLQIEGMAYAFDCNNTPCPDTNIAYSTFYHYEISHRSPTALNSTYLGLWNDVDMGNWADDYIGCDSARALGYVYNGDANDELMGTVGYGINPPAFGVQFLGGMSMDKFMTYDNDFLDKGNPEEAMHYYNYLRGYWRDSTALINNGTNGHYSGGAGNPTDYIFPGNPGACAGIPNGWTEASAGNTPFDRRMVQSTGPMVLQPNATINFDAALIYARGYYNNELGSLCELWDSADSISTWWNNLDKSCFSLVMNRPEPQKPANLTVYPNPAHAQIHAVIPPGLGATSFQVIDLSGRLVMDGPLELDQTEAILPVSQLAEGMYFLKLISQDKVTAAKFKVER